METTSDVKTGILRQIEKSRRELLDLSARNRLINTPRGKTRGRKIDIVDERSEEVFRLLVRESKAMSFLPGEGEAEAENHEESDDDDSGPLQLPQPEERNDDGTIDARHTDLRLQTRLAPERLQSRLLDVYYDAQTYEQEQGVSILYLALGFLKWYESPASDKPRCAPLLLIPVALDRSSANSRFYLKARDEDVTTNLSLQAKLKAEFGVALPDVPEMDELSPSAYFDAVTKVIETERRWEVLRDDMTVWFFSFAKYLMYRDLDPASWPSHSPLGSNPTLSDLLGEGFTSEPPLCGESDKIDPLIPPATMVHVTDADSSQAVVIEEVRQGRHLVVQGPPGTGKSQTITNLIASAVKEGKKVLFVAEKMAALEVVKSRLENLSLGAICLELHSNKANKKAVLAELARTLALGRPKTARSEDRIESLRSAIERLNLHSEIMNTRLQPAGVTPFQVIGHLAHLEAQGAEATSLKLTEATEWSRDRFETLCRDVSDLQMHLQEIGPPSSHPWRGVGLAEHLLPADQKELQTRIAETIASLSASLEAFSEISTLLRLDQPEAPSMRNVQDLALLAQRIVKAPPTMDRSAIAHPDWDSRREEIADLVRAGRDHAENQTALDQIVAGVGWQTDLAATRRSLAAHGRSLFRWFRRDYREALATLQGILNANAEAPRTHEERLTLVDRIIAHQADSAKLSDSQLAENSFGANWKSTASDWDALGKIVEWEAATREAKLAWDCRKILAGLERPEVCRPPLRVLSEHLKPASSRLQEIVKTLAIDVPLAFGRSPNDAPIPSILARLHEWRMHPEALSKWIGYQMRRKALERAGLGPIIAELNEGRINTDQAVNTFRSAYYQELIRDAFRGRAELAKFDGQTHARAIEEFRALDQGRIEMARGEVAAAHHDAIPRSSGGEMAVIRREIEKKRNHKPIRRLIKEAGTAILSIKPVFMMSPISISQYLEPGSVTFDLLLIDEASQVSPVDAFGAMARARQVVVVGDDKQLPPTRFFSKMLDDAGLEDDDDGLSAGDLESILGLCAAQGMSQRMLRWHYRSRHHSLIAVSNREFYENHLYVVPSPTTISAATGLCFRHVKNGVFDRGGSATNRVEAKAIAQAVIEHARRYPKKSLGVGAFSVAQRDAIRDEIELLQREHPELASFFTPGRLEPFFIKNLENIQGDERDVIFISVGYAPDASGYMTMTFGPLSQEGGERRLNVLISRARERCEVFSSITAADIDLQRAKSRGAAAFKMFLRYAETGELDTRETTGGDYDSDFELQVDRAIAAYGHTVHHQIGTAGFIIDLAIVHPNRPGLYVLGIECDGATYHSSRSARDRDRIREKVLHDRGWRIHRVWSTDWFHRPDEQLRKILAAIDAAILDADREEADLASEPELTIEINAEQPAQVERAEPIHPMEGETGAEWVMPYQEAAFNVPRTTAIHDTRPPVLREIVARIVETEGPIHREEVARRVTSLWGLSRTGQRIVETVNQAIDAGLHIETLRADGPFLMHARQEATPQVRSRSGVGSLSLKKPEMIAPAEIRQAIALLVNDNLGLRRDDLPTMIARLFGFKATSAKFKEVVEDALPRALNENLVVLRDEKLYPPCSIAGSVA